MLNVEVFRRAVANEVGEWKEKDGRERRLFALDKAAEVVDEPDLQAMIRSFGDSGFRAAARTSGVVDTIADKTGVSRMFAWFQRLLPRQGNFYEQFARHSAELAAGAEETERRSPGGGGMADHIQRHEEHAHDADKK